MHIKRHGIISVLAMDKINTGNKFSMSQFKMVQIPWNRRKGRQGTQIALEIPRHLEEMTSKLLTMWEHLEGSFQSCTALN